MASPAKIIQTWLIDGGYAILPIASPGASWVVAVGEEGDKPDNFLTLYNTGGVLDGKMMRASGDLQEVIHPGIQLRVRSQVPEEGWTKGMEIIKALIAIQAEPVTIEAVDYLIRAVKLTSPLGQIGKQEKGQRRLLTANFLVTIEEL